MSKSKTQSNPISKKIKDTPWHKKEPAGTSDNYQWWVIDPYLVYVVASTNANYLFEAHPVRVGLNNYSLMLGSLESFSSNAFCVKEVFYIASLYLDPNYIQQVQSMFTRLLEMDDFEIETPIELVQVLGGHFPNKDTFIYYPKPEVM